MSAGQYVAHRGHGVHGMTSVRIYEDCVLGYADSVKGSSWLRPRQTATFFLEQEQYRGVCMLLL